MAAARADRRRARTTRATAARRSAWVWEYVALSTLRWWPRNPKTHDLGAIAASLETIGMRDPLGVARTTREIAEGDGRLEVLPAVKTQGEKRGAPPTGSR
jgi:hypothetical protein